MKISEAADQLIIEQEVSSKAMYQKKYQKPEWPGASSGVTVGIGYDLGQTSKKDIESDWKGVVDDSMLSIMISCSGVTGESAASLTKKVRDKISITWEQAISVHQDKVLPKWESMVANALPNTDKLNPDQFGALVSLAYNRGTSFSSPGDRYSEMRAIKSAMKNQEFDKIPGYFRSMKRLWPNLKGLRTRREAEAKLFEGS